MQRTIKSFVLRAGRVSKRQQGALDSLLKDYQLELSAEPWDLNAIFKRQANTIVEIGFGMGDSLLAMAQNHPELNFIGIEVHKAGIGALVAGLHDQNVSNVRLVAHDAVEVFKYHFAESSVTGVQIFFPDPWHKKRHHKRRLIQPNFVKLLMQRLQPGGFIHCATDWEDYAHHMLAVLSAEQTLRNQNEKNGFTPRPSTRPFTKFEKRGARLGHGVWDLIYVKDNNESHEVSCLKDADPLEF